MPYTIPEYIEIKATDGSTVAFLSPESDGVVAWIDDEQNGICAIEIELPLACEKWAYLTDKYRIYADGKEFVILNPDAVDKQRDGKKLTGKIKAHESWVLLGKKYPTISNDPQNPSPPWGAVIIVSGGEAHGGFDPGSAGSALSYLLQGTGWTVGTVDVVGTYDLETEKESVLYNINQVQEKWGGILIWDSVNKTVSLRDEETYQPYTGYQIRYAKNLKGINRVDDYDIVTRLYPFGENDLNIANVNGGLLYLDNQSYSTQVLEGVWYNQDLADQTQLKTQAEKQLAVMCKPRHNYKTEVLDLRSLPGYGHETFKRSDMADLFDEEFGANARVRIIRYRHNVFQPWLCDMELGDPIEKISATVAQTVLMAKFYKNVVKPNESFQNLLKAIINTAATEINGASGDYTLVDGVSTWKDPDTGDLTRATPKGLIISSDGGQTWKTAISGKGIHADASWVGKLNAGVVTIGAETTFADGYDPTKNSVGMGVDSDCLGLWHFDGSLNSHKGVAAITAIDPLFDTGCFGSAIKPIGTSAPTWTNVVGCSVGSDNSLTKTAATPSWDAGAISTQSISGNGYVSTVVAETNTYRTIGLGNANVDASYTDIEFAIYPRADGTLAVFESGTVKLDSSITYATGDVLKVAVESGVVKYYKNTTLLYTSTVTPIFPLYVDTALFTQGATLKQVQIIGQQMLKAPTTGMLVSAGTINFRAKNLSASANGTVLIDLPKSDNTQGILAGISSEAGHEGELFITTFDTTFDSDFTDGKIYSSDSQYSADYSADKAFDNNETTRWNGDNTKGFPYWINVDLGTGITRKARKLRIKAAYFDGAGVKNFKLQGSNDDINWADVYTGVQENNDNWQEYIFANNNSYRYYRIYITSCYAVTPYASIWEIEMMEATTEATTAYGPHKSALTAWDSISLAWKSDRLSLVVNDSEACYIENPGLPTALGSYLFIGTDRNGANAINTLVDELRVDKVYREVAIRTAWHKTGSPFYTSEEMKQWPGYIRIVTDGVEVYDSSGNLRVKLGSWLKDLLREYGLKVVGGLIMTGEGANRMEFNENGLVGIANNVPRIKMNANDVSGIGYIEFYNSNGDYSGYIGADDLRIGIYGMTPDIDMDIAVVPGAGKKVLVNGSITITGNVLINGNYTATGSKAAVQLTDDYGIRYLYAVEAPEILFYDRGVTNLVNGEATIQLDPIFLECIEPDTELTPWQIWVECYGENDVKITEIGANYFKVKERNGGTSNNKVIWRLEAVRRNYAGIRLMEEVID